MAQEDNKLIVTSNGDDFPITLTARSQGFKRNFANSIEVRDFLVAERQWWSELQKAAAQSASSPEVTANTLPHAGLEGATRALQRFGSSTNASAVDARSILSNFANSTPLLREGKQGKRLQNLAENVPGALPLVAVAEAARLKPSILQHIPNYQLATFDVINVLAGLSYERRAPLAGERAKLEALLSESDGLESTLSARINNFTDWDEKQRTQWASDRTEFLDSFKELLNQNTEQLKLHLAKAGSRVDVYIAESNEKTEEFKKKVRVDVVNEVPTTFWNTKANWHLVTAGVAGLLFVLCGCVGIWFLWTHGATLISTAYQAVGGSTANSALLAVVPIAYVSIPALGLAWLLRHVSRLLIQNLSLAADARLRGTITSTFRALAADRAMTDAELAIALQALFRPIEGKDQHPEIAPPSLADLLNLQKSS